MIKVTCPYCGNTFDMPDPDTSLPYTVWCDIMDTEGCDNLFVIQVDFTPVIKYWTTEKAKEPQP